MRSRYASNDRQMRGAPDSTLSPAITVQRSAYGKDKVNSREQSSARAQAQAHHSIGTQILLQSKYGVRVNFTCKEFATSWLKLQQWNGEVTDSSKEIYNNLDDKRITADVHAEETRLTNSPLANPALAIHLIHWNLRCYQCAPSACVQ